jgi:hypothetical protein
VGQSLSGIFPILEDHGRHPWHPQPMAVRVCARRTLNSRTD